MNGALEMSLGGGFDEFDEFGVPFVVCVLSLEMRLMSLGVRLMSLGVGLEHELGHDFGVILMSLMSLGVRLLHVRCIWRCVR